MVYWVRFQKRVGRPCASTENEVAASTRSRRGGLDIMNMNLGLGLVGTRARLTRMGPRVQRQLQGFAGGCDRLGQLGCTPTVTPRPLSCTHLNQFLYRAGQLADTSRLGLTGLHLCTQ